MSSPTFHARFKGARVVSTPLVAINTPDPAATSLALLGLLKPDDPMILWDACRGWRPANKAGKDAIALVMADIAASNGMPDAPDPAMVTMDPTEMLKDAAPLLPERSVLCLFNPQRYLNERGANGAKYVQALWNLRDAFKANQRTIVLMGGDITLPPEIARDVLTIDEPLPDDEALTTIVTRTAEEAKLKAVDVPAAIAALRGLPSFSAEQATALACDLRAKVLNIGELWTRKEQMIAQTPGLSVYKGTETFDDVGGCEQAKLMFTMRYNGKLPFDAILWWDEVEKMFAGTAGDNTGIMQAIFGMWLTWQQEKNKTGSSGALFVGPPGAAKSMIAQTAGATFGVPTVAVDIGGTKDSLVGSTERNFRTMLKTIDAIGARVLTVMTCNKQIDIAPEMKRRLTAGMFYFDLPDDDEAKVIWTKKRTLYDIEAKQRQPVSCKGWTGAEIHTACRLHWELGVPLHETGQYIVPVVRSAAASITALRKQADGTFLSASKPGVYSMASALPLADGVPTRRIAQEV